MARNIEGISVKYSIIICYRNREEHLKTLVPRLRETFGTDGEIIVVEQNDDTKFLRGQMFNAGAQYSSGSIIVFHDADHFPISADVGFYDPNGYDAWLPIKRVEYVTNDLQLKPLDQVPSGYRHFRDKVDDNFFGGVEVFKREAFFRINGFNSLYRGWGLEDADLRERIQHYELSWARGIGHFYALDHKDSCPSHDDVDFQRNNHIFMQWQNHLSAGVTTQNQTVDEITPKVAGVGRWLQVSNVFTLDKDAQQYASVNALAKYYEDMPEKHTAIWTSFKKFVNDIDALREHRNWVISNNFGYGNRAFHWMWNIIVKDLPREFKFLEVGVYMGQIISLMSMLNKAHDKRGLIFGITPLTNAGDKHSKHPDVNYEEAIARIYYQFGLDGNDLQLIEGFSQDRSVIAEASRIAPYDVVYIDGCHDYEVVKSDIENYSTMLKVGGLLVMDDASCSLNIPENLIRMNWKGLTDVCEAISDTLEKDARFEHLFAVGHNRCWKRIR